MHDGIKVERMTDGNVCVIATARGRTIKFRVEPGYARRLSVELAAAAREPSWANRLIEHIHRWGE